LGLTFLCLGLYFFADGLDSANDYLRLSHGIWHLCASVFGYCCIEAVRVRPRHAPVHKHDEHQLLTDKEQE
jgi:hypothetical protein